MGVRALVYEPPGKTARFLPDPHKTLLCLIKTQQRGITEESIRSCQKSWPTGAKDVGSRCIGKVQRSMLLVL